MGLYPSAALNSGYSTAHIDWRDACDYGAVCCVIAFTSMKARHSAARDFGPAKGDQEATQGLGGALVLHGVLLLLK